MKKALASKASDVSQQEDRLDVEAPEVKLSAVRVEELFEFLYEKYGQGIFSSYEVANPSEKTMIAREILAEGRVLSADGSVEPEDAALLAIRATLRPTKAGIGKENCLASTSTDVEATDVCDGETLHALLQKYGPEKLADFQSTSIPTEKNRLVLNVRTDIQEAGGRILKQGEGSRRAVLSKGDAALVVRTALEQPILADNGEFLIFATFETSVVFELTNKTRMTTHEFGTRFQQAHGSQSCHQNFPCHGPPRLHIW